MLPPADAGRTLREMLKELLQRPAAQAWLSALLGRYLEFALRTTRWTLHGSEHFAPHAEGSPCIAAFWHERLPLMPVLCQRARARSPGTKIHVLVSRHRDGRFIGDIMRRFDAELVYGSSQGAGRERAGRGRAGRERAGRERGGAAGALVLLDMLRGGDHVVITPDGPRGPRREAAPGVAQLAALSGAPVLPCAAQTRRRRVLRSWDRMVIPLPWGRGVLVCGASIRVPREGWEASLAPIAAAMTEAADCADRLCR